MAAVIGKFFLRETLGSPKLRFAVWKLKAALHHADHDALLIVQRDFFAENLRIAAESSKPEAMTENRDRSGPRNVILRAKVATQLRCHTQDRKEICSHVSPGKLFWNSLAGKIERAAKTGGSHVAKDLIARFPIREISGRGCILREPIGRSVFPNDDEPIRITIRKRANEDGIGNAEDCRVRSDSQGQNCHGEKSKAGALA